MKILTNNDIHTDITGTIRRECSNIDDVEGYVYNCLLFSLEAGAEFYKTTTENFNRIAINAMNEVIIKGDLI